MLQKEMDNLKQTVLKMSDAVINNINLAMKCYFERLDNIKINDDLIDSYERIIEETSINILLKERPYARDLKECTGILKLVSDIERIGDHAEDIVEFSNKLNKCNVIQDNTDIQMLSEFVVKMVNDSILSFVNMDTLLANKVINDDDFVDNKYLEIIQALSIKEKYDSNYLLFAIYTTLVVKYLERIADHAVNIAEWVVYISNGYYKDKMIL